MNRGFKTYLILVQLKLLNLFHYAFYFFEIRSFKVEEVKKRVLNSTPYFNLKRSTTPISNYFLLLINWSSNE